MILIPSQYAPASASAFSNASGSEFIIDHFVASNNDTGTQTLSVWVTSGANDNSNLLLKVPLAAGQSYRCAEVIGDVLSVGESVWVQASTASTIAIKVSGRTR